MNRNLLFLLAIGFLGYVLLAGGGGVVDDELNQNTTVPNAEETTAHFTANPWNDRVLNVSVQNNISETHNLTLVTLSAIEYWNKNQNLTAYNAQLRYVSQSKQADIIVRYQHEVDCGFDAVGCAFIITNDTDVQHPEMVDIQYEKEDNYRLLRDTTVHEFGHIFGLDHDDKPHYVMDHEYYNTNDTGYAIDAENRTFPWTTRTLYYHIDESFNQSQVSQIEYGLDYYRQGADGAVPDDLRLVRTDNKWRADIEIHNGPYDDYYAYTPWVRYGDYDSDGKDELYYKINVTLHKPPVKTTGYNVASALTSVFTPNDTPPALQDNPYISDRVDWYNETA